MTAAAPLPRVRDLASRSSMYWLRAAVIGEDVIGGRVSLAAEDGERENFHRSVRALPAARGHAGHITCRQDIAGHSLNSRLCRVPAHRPLSLSIGTRWPRVGLHQASGCLGAGRLLFPFKRI